MRAVVIAALAACALLTPLVDSAAARATGRSSPEAAPAGGSLHCDRSLQAYIEADPIQTRANRAVDAHGTRYVPYGISVMGLQQWGGLSPLIEHDIDNQIEAATTGWHANTVRLQIAPVLWEQDPGGFWSALDHEVGEIVCAGDIAVLNDNPLFTTRQPNPTAVDLAFDRALARRYRNLNAVFIDPFNEPHLNAPPGAELAEKEWMWRIWRDGGTVAGVRYVGMQALIDAIREQAPRKIIWAEMPHWSSDFSLLRDYPLSGSNIELEFHHPDENDPRSWAAMMVPTGRPRVEGELSQYSSTTRPECYSTAYGNLPRVLSMDVKYHDGAVAWTLEPNVLVASEGISAPVTNTIDTAWYPTSERALLDPSEMNSGYACTGQGQGMGELATRLFARLAARANPYSALYRYRR
jgi:Cellulase (glycosyl hydrolase family 5)